MLPSEMSVSIRYDEDILLWSEEQAEIIRRLGRTRRDLPNELDVENVAEEIESVGRSESASVETFLRLMMIPLIKIASVPNSPTVAHWDDEARNFRADALTRSTPSMAQRIDLSRAWRLACEQAASSLAKEGDPVLALPSACPFTVEELVREPLDPDALLIRLRDISDADEPAGSDTQQ
jgi:hypothetical protein